MQFIAEETETDRETGRQGHNEIEGKSQIMSPQRLTASRASLYRSQTSRSGRRRHLPLHPSVNAGMCMNTQTDEAQKN